MGYYACTFIFWKCRILWNAGNQKHSDTIQNTIIKILIAVITLTHKYALNGLVQAAEAV